MGLHCLEKHGFTRLCTLKFIGVLNIALSGLFGPPVKGLIGSDYCAQKCTKNQKNSFQGLGVLVIFGWPGTGFWEFIKQVICKCTLILHFLEMES